MFFFGFADFFGCSLALWVAFEAVVEGGFPFGFVCDFEVGSAFAFEDWFWGFHFVFLLVERFVFLGSPACLESQEMFLGKGVVVGCFDDCCGL